MQSYLLCLCLVLFAASNVHSFTAPTKVAVAARATTTAPAFSLLSMAPKDPSRSGTKRGRLDKLAEMEELGSANTDNSVFIKAAGGFVALIVVAIAAAAASGLLL